MRRLLLEVDGVVDTGRVGRRVLGGVPPGLNGHDYNVTIEEDQWNGIQMASGREKGKVRLLFFWFEPEKSPHHNTTTGRSNKTAIALATTRNKNSNRSRSGRRQWRNRRVRLGDGDSRELEQLGELFHTRIL